MGIEKKELLAGIQYQDERDENGNLSVEECSRTEAKVQLGDILLLEEISW